MEALLNGNDFRSAGATSQGCTRSPHSSKFVNLHSSIFNKKARPKPGLCCSELTS